MTAGIQITQERINTQAGAITASVFAAMQNVAEFKAWLDGVTAQDLQTTYSFTADDAAVLKSAFTDLGDLAAVWAGGSLAAPRDFRTFAKRLIGVGVY